MTILLTVLLTAGGLALAATGALALRGRAFGAMPRPLALAVVVVGAGVVAFGTMLPGLERTPEPPPERRELPLEPVPHGDDTGERDAVRTEVSGAVRTVTGEPVIGAEAVLASGTEVIREATTDADGTFSFAEVDVTGFPYEVLVDHEGATFSSGPFGIGTDEVVVEVAPTTQEPGAVRIRASSIAVVGDEEGIQAVHALTVHNAGEEAYAGGVPLALLPGASLIEPQRGMSRWQMVVPADGRGLRARMPVLPGTTELAYTYVAPLPRRGLAFTYEAGLPTGRFDALVADGLEVTAPGADPDTIVLDGRTYHSRSWRDLDTREVAELTISSPEPVPVLRVGVIVVAALLAVAILAVPLVRRRRPPDPTVPAAPERAPAPERP